MLLEPCYACHLNNNGTMTKLPDNLVHTKMNFICWHINLFKVDVSMFPKDSHPYAFMVFIEIVIWIIRLQIKCICTWLYKELWLQLFWKNNVQTSFLWVCMQETSRLFQLTSPPLPPQYFSPCYGPDLQCNNCTKICCPLSLLIDT